METQLQDSRAGAIDIAMDILNAGGPVVGILVAMSVVALSIMLAKLWQFHALRLGDRDIVARALWLHRRGRTSEAAAGLRGTVNPVGQLVAMALHGQRRCIAEDRIREEMMRAGAESLGVLRSWLRPLEVIAGLAPLLGLFGTVLGMIEAFRQLEQAGNQVNPAVLSGGIWEALLTTAVGLAVAMPVVAVLNFLESRVEKAAHDMDDAIAKVFVEELSIASGDQADVPSRLGQTVAGD